MVSDPFSQECREEAVLRRAIPGEDGRCRILETAKWPYSVHGQVIIFFAESGEYGGSGAMVGPHHVLTCGHNVYSLKTKTFAEKILYYPALNGDDKPFGEIVVTKAYVFRSWVDDGEQGFDMALLLLGRSIGQSTGWCGLLSTNNARFPQERIHITGYPADKKSCEMWSMDHTMREIKDEQLSYDIDTYGGQSGSAVWINQYGGPLIVGVHTLGGNINLGVRLSHRKFDVILNLISSTRAIMPSS